MRILILLIAIIGISDIQGQVMLSAQQVERLEAGLLATPTDFGSRLRLLRYYSSTAMPAAQAIEYRRRHLLWLIRNHPEEEFLGTSMGLIFRKEDRLADPRGYLEAAGIWRKNISANNVQAMTLVNAAEFFATEDREYAVTILNTGLRQFPGHQRLGNLKGSISAMIVTGAGKLDQNGLFSSFTPNALQTEASIKSQRELGLQQDSNVLIGAASCIAQQYYEFQTQDNAAARELFALAETYVARAHRLQPNNPQLQFAIANLYLSAANSTLASEEKVHLLEFGAVLLTLPQPRSILLAALAEAHFDNRQFDAAALNSKEVLAIAADVEPISPAYSFDDSIHQANTILGRVALKSNRTSEAIKHLIAAGQVPPTPALRSFGPKWTLARELHEAGESAAVIQYIGQIKAYWKEPGKVLDDWVETIRFGDTPDFGGRIRWLIGTMAPSFSLKDLDGREHSLDQYRGKVVLLDFWATWCAPCRKEMPEFEKLHLELSRKDVAILAVNVSEDISKVASYIKKERFTFPVLMSDGEMPDKYHVSGYPTLVVIDKNGRVADYLGTVQESELRTAIDRARAGAPPSAKRAVARAAPVQGAPSTGALFHHFPRTTQFTWSPVQDATAYILEWDFKENGNWASDSNKSVVSDPLIETAFIIEFIGVQLGRWRVWAVFADGKISAKSGWREFSFSH